AGQRIKQSRLARIRIAGKRERGQVRPLALGAHRPACRLRPLEPPLQRRDAVACQPAVGLDLRLARATRANAADAAPGAEALEVRPQPPHACEVVLELRELDLKLALSRVRMAREDVEDDRRAVD